ncbi:hypothetical protein DINM_021599 [Dirofilaria immitis]|nr:hypothetical protein [Dirofilaria immitis]
MGRGSLSATIGKDERRVRSRMSCESVKKLVEVSGTAWKRNIELAYSLCVMRQETDEQLDRWIALAIYPSILGAFLLGGTGTTDCHSPEYSNDSGLTTRQELDNSCSSSSSSNSNSNSSSSSNIESWSPSHSYNGQLAIVEQSGFNNGRHNTMSIRSMDSRLEVLRNGQDITNKSLLYNVGSAQQPQQQLPNVDVDNESNKSDSWVELASPSSQASIVSMNGGDNGSVVLVESDGAVMGIDNTTVVVGGSNGSPFSRLSPISACSAPIELVFDAGQVHSSDTMEVHYYTRHGPGRCTVATTGIAGFGQGTKRTAEWLEHYNSRPEAPKISSGPQAPSPVETEMSTPPNSLVPGLDVGELTQSSCCEDEDEQLSVEDDGAELLGINDGNGRRVLVLYLVTNLVTLTIGFAVGRISLLLSRAEKLAPSQIMGMSMIYIMSNSQIANMFLCGGDFIIEWNTESDQRAKGSPGQLGRYRASNSDSAWCCHSWPVILCRLRSASTAGTSETVEIRGESKNGVSNHLEENELADDFVARQKQFGRKLEMRGSSTRIVVVGGMAENMLGKFALLYDKYNAQCNELESLEKANSELKEQLQKVRHEYANTQEVLNRCRSDFSAHCEGLECRIVDVELQLKMTTQRIEAREEHYQQRIKQNDAKWDQKFGQLLKRTEVVEKEKNDAVCRYVAREAQLMRLQTQIETLEVQKNMLLAEKSTLQKSTQFEYVQNMKHSLAEVERQLALEKEASKEREEQYKMTIKHLEAKSVESQRAMEQMEKEDYQQKFRKAQTMLKTLEQQCAEEVDAVIKKRTISKNNITMYAMSYLLLGETETDLSKAVAYSRILAESQQLRQNLEQARQNHQIALEKLESLEQMQTHNLRRVKLAEIAAMDAAAERDQAEVEAAECRRQAERMLEITEQLADKNSSLTSQQEMLRFKNLELNQRVKTLESSVSAYEKHIVELDQELNLLKVDNSAKIGALRQQIDANISKEQKLNAVINELRNEQEVLRKKNSSSLKELRAEVQHLRKLQSQSSNLSPTNASDNLSFTVLPNGIASSFTGAVGPSISSRTSSIASSSDICSSTTGYNTILISRTAADQKESQQFIASPSSDETNHLQQQMIEKIVKLQRQLARRQDKIEFLEEHVQQCTQELLKKTKIIQNYALREEASLLLPENDLNKLLETCEVIEMPRRISDNCNTSSPLIGNLFASSTSGMTGKSALKFAAEVNSRLQAVLEDALHKNITLKNNIDILGEEISRLSRENRRLALSKIVANVYFFTLEKLELLKCLKRNVEYLASSSSPVMRKSSNIEFDIYDAGYSSEFF